MIRYNHSVLSVFFMPGWRNWQTRTFEGRVKQFVEVQVLSRAQHGIAKGNEAA